MAAHFDGDTDGYLEVGGCEIFLGPFGREGHVRRRSIQRRGVEKRRAEGQHRRAGEAGLDRVSEVEPVHGQISVLADRRARIDGSENGHRARGLEVGNERLPHVHLAVRGLLG